MNRFGRWAAVGVLAAGLLGGAAHGWSRVQPPDQQEVDGFPQPLPQEARPTSSPAPATPEVVRAEPARSNEPAVQLAWVPPAEVRVNRPAPYTLRVTNTGGQPVQKVVVQVRTPAGVVAGDTDPPAKVVGDVLMWELGTLPMREVQDLKVKFTSPTRGELTAQAWVTFTGSAAVSVAVKEPKLEAYIEVPETVEIGSSILVRYGVRNIGDCPAAAVVTATGGPNDLGSRGFTGGGQRPSDLPPTYTTDILWFDTARTPGVFTYTVTAESTDGQKATASTKVRVLARKLEVSFTGPAELGLTRSGEYRLKVTNTGDLKAEDVKCALDRGAGVPFREGLIANGPNPPFVGFNLDPGESREFVFTGDAAKPGECVHKVSATDRRGVSAAAECRTVVKGIPGIRMEVIDTVDPVEAGKDTVYEIKVSNTGSEPDRNLRLVCDLPPGMTLVAATGPVEYLERIGVNFDRPGPDKNVRTVTFEPVRELGPKTEVVFKLTVKAGRAGNARFKAILTSDHLTTPVTKEESTTVYGD